MGSETLPSLISDLTSSEGESERMKVKTRFIERYQVLDTKLNRLFQNNSDNFSSVRESTSKVITVLKESKEKCQRLKSRILMCREMLDCKRDEIRKLWLDSLQHKYIHKMLEEVEKLSEIPLEINKDLNGKKYIYATEVLVSSLCILEGNFKDVDGLKELKTELYRFKEKLCSIFTDELRQELYWSTFHRVYNTSSIDGDKTVTYEAIFQNHILKDGGVNTLCLNSSYVKVLLECLSLLQKCPETLEAIKEDCHDELVHIVKKLSKFMHDILQKSTDQRLLDLPDSNQQNFLIDLLETIFDHFRCIALNYKEFLDILENIFPNACSNESYMQLEELYSNIQITIELFVSCYLEQQSSENIETVSTVSVFSSSQNMNELSSFFDPQFNSACSSLFKFSNSASGLKKNRKNADLQKPNYVCSDSSLKNLVLVCKPTLKNITLIFNPLKQFVLELESFLLLDKDTHCPLHTYLYDTALVFLDQVNSEINKILENASISLNSWSTAVVPGDEPGAEKQILSSTLILNSSLHELQFLIQSLPDYSNHFLHLIYFVILDYKDMLLKTFKILFGEEHNILSVSWAKDHDIRRLLKSFSNWKHLEETNISENLAFPEEIRQRNKEESRLLIRNLHSEERESWEVITDFNVLLNLAVLQESSQWFSVQLLSFVNQHFNQIDSLDSDLNNAVKGLKKLVKEYEDFADVCLLTLHLEVRAHCFNHLLPPNESDISIDAFFNQGFETSVQDLTKKLAKIDETLHSVLTSKELKYIFEGLSELVASILIQNVSILTSAPEKLIKRLIRSIFVLQCSLNNITSTREVALEKTRHYVQLLNLTCDDILNEIMAEGSLFSECEYVALFRLILDRDNANDNVIRDYSTKLQNILKKISVNI